MHSGKVRRTASACSRDVTEEAGSPGHQEARSVDRLLPALYAELHRLAQNLMHRERRDHTLEPTALVHEAYLRLVRQTRVDWSGRTHVLGVAALAMRRVLVDHARSQRRRKGSVSCPGTGLDLVTSSQRRPVVDALDLEEALERLAGEGQRLARLVELRFFAGLSHEEIASLLGVSRRTIERDWRYARARLIAHLGFTAD